MAKAQAAVKELGFPFETGIANTELLDKLDAFEEVLISLRSQPDALPKSYLIDQYGRLAAIYPGQISVEQVLKDVSALDRGALPDEAFPFAGRWFAQPRATGTLLVDLVREFEKRKHSADALRFAGLAADLATRDAIAPDLASELATLFYDAGRDSLRSNDLDSARRHYEACIGLAPRWAQAHTNLGAVYRTQGTVEKARQHLYRALQIDPELIQAHLNLGVLSLDQEKPAEAVEFFHAAVKLNPNSAANYNYLGIALARSGSTSSAIDQFRKASSLGSEEALVHISNVMDGKIP